MQAQPISICEIESYCRLIGAHDARLRLNVLDFVQMADRKYFDLQEELK